MYVYQINGFNETPFRNISRDLLQSEKANVDFTLSIFYL